jgi:hypothetical protein
MRLKMRTLKSKIGISLFMILFVLPLLSCQNYDNALTSMTENETAVTGIETEVPEELISKQLILGR